MSKPFSKYYLPLVFALLLIAGILIGNQLNFNGNSKAISIYPQHNKLQSVLNYIEEEYVDTIHQEDLVELMIPKILEELDPHSVYIPPQDLEFTNEQLHGAFDGIGVQFNLREDTVVIVHPIPGGPSEKVGILAGDRIIKVGDSLIAGVGVTTETVMSLLKGKKGTVVDISIQRYGDEELLPFSITRDKIPIYSLDVAYMMDEKVGYIKMNRFARNTYQEFIDAGDRLLAQGMEKLIVDLRGNSGGFMEMAIKMIDEFFEAGTLIVYTEGKARPRSESLSKSGGRFTNTPVVVLIDEWSASASEIFAGAIQDNDRGVIVGRRSYGKGLVQEQREFPDGSALRLTIARYFTPTGRSIQTPYENGKQDDMPFGHPDLSQWNELAADSSNSTSDTTVYLTPKGKQVFGGGGITPDHIVAIDTLPLSDFYIKVRNRGLIYQFGFQYADRHRSELVATGDYKSLVKLLDKRNLHESFLDFAASKDIKPSSSDWKRSEKIIRTMIHAQIARSIFDDQSYYPLIQEIDESLLIGKSIIDTLSYQP